MFDKYTDRARKTMSLARMEAQRLSHEAIGTEHILLGLLKEGSGVAARALINLGMDFQKVVGETERMVQAEPKQAASSQIPFTPRVKKVLEFAHEYSEVYNLDIRLHQFGIAGDCVDVRGQA